MALSALGLPSASTPSRFGAKFKMPLLLRRADMVQPPIRASLLKKPPARLGLPVPDSGRKPSGRSESGLNGTLVVSVLVPVLACVLDVLPPCVAEVAPVVVLPSPASGTPIPTTQRRERDAAARRFFRQLRLVGRRGEVLARLRDAEASLLVGERLLVERGEQARRRVPRAVSRLHRVERLGDVLIVLIGDERPFALREPACERLLVQAGQIAAGPGEHAVDLIRNVRVGRGEHVGKAGRIARIEEARLQIGIELRRVLAIRALRQRRISLRVAAGEQVARESRRRRQELAYIPGARGEPLERVLLRRRDRSRRQRALQLRQNAAEERLRGRPWRRGAARRAGARVLELLQQILVERAVRVFGLCLAAHESLRSSPRKRGSRDHDPRLWVPACAGTNGAWR